MIKLDVFFYHINEYYHQDHYQHLLSCKPDCRLVTGHEGVAEVFLKMADLSRTSHFITVDADNWISPDFSWQPTDWTPEDQRIHVWRCHNPLTGLTYGHGAVKLWPKELILSQPDLRAPDYTCALAKEGFYIEPEVASELRYFEEPYSVWSQAYKECVKLAADFTLYHGTEASPETPKRIAGWMTVADENISPYHQLSRHGACLGTLEGISASGKADLVKAALKKSRASFSQIEQLASDEIELKITDLKNRILTVKSELKEWIE